MKFTSIILFLLILSSKTFCQKNDFNVVSSNTVLGRNLITNTDIKGVQYQFPNHIYKTSLDTTTGFLTVQLRGLSKNKKWLKNKGTILQYDLNNNKLLWSKKIHYQSSGLQFFTGVLIYTVAGKSYLLNPNTGKKQRELSTDIFYVDPDNKIGIGYKHRNPGNYSDKLQGVDLKTGNIIWERKIIRDFGWNDLQYLNDSTLIIVAAGLHTINLFNGKGWDYNTKTGKKDYTEAVITDVAGVALGILTGTFVTATGHNLVRDIVSNVLIDSSSVYLSSREQLVKIDKKTGEIVWKNVFPKDLPSKSIIFSDDTLIYMINKGYAYMGNRQLNFGKPFLAAYDKKTGKQKYLSLIGVVKESILSSSLFNNEIFLIFKNRLAKYSIKTGQLIGSKKFQKENIGEMKYFVGNSIFIENNDDKLISLPQFDTTNLFFYTNKEKVYSINEQLNITDTIEINRLLYNYMKTKNFRFLATKKKTLIIDNKGNKIAKVQASSNAMLLTKTLYDKQNNSFIAIDLKELLNN